MAGLALLEMTGVGNKAVRKHGYHRPGRAGLGAEAGRGQTELVTALSWGTVDKEEGNLKLALSCCLDPWGLAWVSCVRHGDLARWGQEQDPELGS